MSCAGLRFSSRDGRDFEELLSEADGCAAPCSHSAYLLTTRPFGATSSRFFSALPRSTPSQPASVSQAFQCRRSRPVAFLFMRAASGVYFGYHKLLDEDACHGGLHSGAQLAGCSELVQFKSRSCAICSCSTSRSGA